MRVQLAGMDETKQTWRQKTLPKLNVARAGSGTTSRGLAAPVVARAQCCGTCR